MTRVLSSSYTPSIFFREILATSLGAVWTYRYAVENGLNLAIGSRYIPITYFHSAYLPLNPNGTIIY